MMIFNIASLTLLLLSWLLPRASDSENFGTGSIRSKIIVLGVAIFFIIFIVGFRTGTAWSAARLASDAAWYDSKAAFYVILFGFEIIIVYLFLFTQFHRMFWVPNGSNKPGDYSQIELDGSTEKKSSEQHMPWEQDSASVQDSASTHDKA